MFVFPLSVTKYECSLAYAQHTYRRDETLLPLSVGTTLPPHASTQRIREDELGLSFGHERVIIRDHGLLVGVVRVRCVGRVVVQDLRARLRQHFVVPHPVLPAALTDGVEGLAWSGSVEECAAVQGHAEDHLVWCDVRHVDVVVERSRGAEWSALWVGGVRVEVCLVAGDLVPRARVVVSVVWEGEVSGGRYAV